MITKTIEVCDAVLYDVSCKENDSCDIRCGGPAILGYEFGVSPDENKEEMINHIKTCIKKYNIPFMYISTRIIKNFPVNSLWTKESIENCIKENGIW
jgi:hypothetical protein